MWPDWLKSTETGHFLELYLYNEELGIAVEYYDQQHYKYIPSFHKNGMSDFENQVRTDNCKINLCDENGVWLIVVPYNVPVNKIESYIRHYLPEKC